MAGVITVEICKANSEDALRALVNEAIHYWTSEQKGYELLSDDKGPDVLIVREGATLSATGYTPGPTITAWQDGIVLVFQRNEAPPKKK